MKRDIDKYDVIVSMLAATKAELTSIVETQTLMQVLVKKGLVSADEIKQTRKAVEKNSPKVQHLYQQFKDFDTILSIFDRQDEEKHKFMSLLDKMIQDRDSLTEEELDYLDSKLDFKKYQEDSNQ